MTSFSPNQENGRNKYTMEFLLKLYEDEEITDLDFKGKQKK